MRRGGSGAGWSGVGTLASPPILGDTCELLQHDVYLRYTVEGKANTPLLDTVNCHK